ncbi:MAG: hypothetical protein CMH49_09390 [Myxococcales bacterium]|nr:hypothetical protein [Myxococcales bacterium]
MKTHKEIYTELQNTDIVIRKQVLKEALNLPILQKLELCSLFQPIGPIVDRTEFQDVLVLDNWSDAMITFYFQTFNEYIRSLEGQSISLNLNATESLESTQYDGLEPQKYSFKELLSWEREWVKKEFHEHPTLQIFGIGTRLVKCLIEDSSCLAWLPGRFFLNCVRCTFQSLDCRYLQQYGEMKDDDESPYFFFLECSFEDIQNLKDVYSSIIFGLEHVTLNNPLHIPAVEQDDPFIFNLQLKSYINIACEQRNFKALSLLGSELAEYSWLKGATIVELVVSWRTLAIILKATQENPPKIKILNIVRDNDVQICSDTYADIPVGIEKCGIEIIASDCILWDLEDTPTGLQALMNMYAKFPNLKHVFFPCGLDEKKGTPQHGVWIEAPPWPNAPYVDEMLYTDMLLIGGERSLDWNSFGICATDCLHRGIELDLEATKKQLNTIPSNRI